MSASLFPGAPTALHHPSHVSSRDPHQPHSGPPPAGSTKHMFQQRPQAPTPAHSSSIKKPGTSLSLEDLKRHSQFTPPGFPLGFPSQLLSGSGLPAQMAAALASGRYPPGFMQPGPALPPGFSAPRSSFFPSTSQHSSMNSAAAVAQVASASAKLQELQNRVMASSRPPGLHQLSQASGNPGPSIASMSNAAQGLPPSSLAASQYTLSRKTCAS